MTEQILLHSVDAEHAALGACVYGPKYLEPVISILRPEMFFYEANRVIFEAVLALRKRRIPVDLVTLEAELVKTGTLEAAGGRAALVRCAETTVTPINGPHYAAVVKEYWALRETERLCADLAQQIRDPEHAAELPKTLLATKTRIDQVLSSATREGYKLTEVDFTECKRTLPSSLPTLNGYAEHDGALVKGQIHVYGAREGVGKSVLLVQETLALLRDGHSGAYYSLTDLDQDDIGRRMMRQITGWATCPDSDHMAANWHRDKDDLADPMQDREFQIFTGRTHGMTVEDVMARIQALHTQTNLDFAVVDYLQALKPTKEQRRMNQFDRIAENARTLEWFAADLNLALLVGSQITSRDGTTEAKGGRDVSEAANLVLFLKRDQDNQDSVTATVAKLRYGRGGGAISLNFDRSKLRFDDWGNA